MAGKKDVTAYKRPHKLKYGKWGLIFILPFFICYGIFQLYPLIATFYRSFFHDKTDIFLNSVFEFAGFENYIDLFTKYDIVIRCYCGCLDLFRRLLYHCFLHLGLLTFD